MRQHSTVEFLPGMIHTDSPTGLLPKFPSWALVCVGKSTLYSHTQGMLISLQQVLRTENLYQYGIYRNLHKFFFLQIQKLANEISGKAVCSIM